MRIVFLPVDERFCTRDYMMHMGKSFNLDIETPPIALLGQKKIPGDVDAIYTWLEKTIDNDDTLILSLDTLIYGGLIPSRINRLTEQTLLKRLKRIRPFRQKAARIYLTSTVMRIPQYNSEDEEPVYWEYFGKRLHDFTKVLAGTIKKRISDGHPFRFESYKTIIDENKSHKLLEDVPLWVIDDYFDRRIKNARMIEKTFSLVQEGIVDYFNLTLDDNGKDSLSLIEASRHQQTVDALQIHEKCAVHPGADEATLTLLSRAVCQKFNIIPPMEIQYLFEDKKDIVPPYEGDTLDQTIKNHIRAAGGRVGQSSIKLLVNNSETEEWIESPEQDIRCRNENGVEWLEKGLKTNNIMGLVDIRYPNGSDRLFVKQLLSRKRVWNRINYAAWNTPSNTIGTVVAFSILQYLAAKSYLQIDSESMERFQQIMLLEQYGYQANLREELRRQSYQRGCSIWTLLPVEKWAESFAQTKLADIQTEVEKSFNHHFNLEVFFPWHRSFEIGIRLSKQASIDI